MSAYYNEIDPFAAAWLRELIKAGLIADGEVDERSIAVVRPDDLRGFTQCHFFAGIGGWSLALRLAGWSDDRHVWTGSCPCQPFSSAGAQTGGNDSRDLWPVWFQLVKECRPVVVFGEQVEAAIGHGWLDRLCDDLESENYAVGAVGLPGPCVGAFDIRQRLWFVADADECGGAREGVEQTEQGEQFSDVSAGASGMADAECAERRPLVGPCNDERDWRDAGRSEAHGQPRARRQVCSVADAGSERRQQERRSTPRYEDAHGWESDGYYVTASHGEADELVNAASLGQPGRRIDHRSGATGERRHATEWSGLRGETSQRCAPGGFWSDADWIDCADGKARPVEPGTFPLAHGVPARVGRLRGYGNAIKPQVAQAFIEAYMSAVAPPDGSHGHKSDTSASEGPLRRQEADAETTTPNGTQA